jgi:hypothetical protein
MSGQPLWKLAWGPNMSGLRLSCLRNCVRSDMSGLGVGHVWEMPLESSLEAEYAWLTREKAERSDISGLGGGEHVLPESLESG